MYGDLLFDITTDIQALVRVTADARFVMERTNRAYRQFIATAFPGRADVIEGRDRNEFLASLGLATELVEEELPQYRTVVTSRSAVRYEIRFPAAESIVVLEVSIWPLVGDAGEVTHVLWSARDVSRRVLVEEQLRASLRDKETLLREVHHRVRNNLQLVCSLLGLRRGAAQDPSARAMLQECEERIRSIAMIHEQLYRSSDLASIDLSAYLRGLVATMAQAHHGGGRLAVQCQDDLVTGLDTAVPIGSILHELASNALKHAFPPGRMGLVEVRCRRDADVLILTVQDDGVGIPADWEARSRATLGLSLVRALAQQLDALFELRNEAGTVATVAIPWRGSEGA